ncbi:helix-turn-helix domain-containing protein [Ruminococcus sp.]|uniref:helix-turn-helix domain-containing protein n=1 Tax=Ruminococcus sp. TaxID=41978 RepID=UPI001B75DC7E|nr:helix-turn-helix domain-containing protein [Ruminococcus sp.]MBP5431596.1 DUF739 domain-containing protein [Ruminococcus sp.]
MLNVLEFKAAMVRKGFNQKKLSQELGISEKTFCNRLKKKQFGTDEIEKLIPLLEITDPMRIFFGNLVTCKDTKLESEET